MSLPTQIRKRDGRLVSFQPEKISRTLFAITEELGSPDSFLAHELTDGILHFLEQDAEMQSLTTDHLGDLIVKIVRELGQPAIAKRIEESESRIRAKSDLSTKNQSDIVPPLSWLPVHQDYWIARDYFIEYSLKHVIPHDLVAAHRDGFLELLDLECPAQLSAGVLSPNSALPLDYWKLFECVSGARFTKGWLIAIDGLEHSLAAHTDPTDGFVRGYLAHLQRCLDRNKLFATVNLNCFEPPIWASPSTGPLFPDSTDVVPIERLNAIADQVIEQFQIESWSRIDWHLSMRDLEPGAQSRLERIVAQALRCRRIDFVFDRPGRPITLYPGLERGGPGILGRVRLVLNRFVEMLGGGTINPTTYLKKLATLARFAKEAGFVRQDYLRKHGLGELRSGYLLERAQFLVLHKGLIESAMMMLGPSADELAVVDLAQRSIETIQAALGCSSSRLLSSKVEWQPTFDHPAGNETSIFAALGEGNQIWQRQLRHANRLSRVDGNGVLSIGGNRDESVSIQHVSEVLRASWKSDVCRVRFDRQVES